MYGEFEGINREEEIEMDDCERKLNEIRIIVQDVLNKHGHDRCHYHPEEWGALANILGVERRASRCLPPLDEFLGEKGCRGYARREFGFPVEDYVI